MHRKKCHTSRHIFFHWTGFFFSAAIITLVTAYGFSLSLHPQTFTLESAGNEPLALVGVAMANNIGTGIPRGDTIPVQLPPDVETVQNALIRDALSGEDFFDEHFHRISELTELVNIDPVAYLRIHPDKQTALDNYIVQLDEKQTEGKNAMSTLTQLKDLHTNGLADVQAEIKNIQAVIESAYSARDSDTIIQGIADLEELHITEQEHKNVIVFSQRFIKEYTELTTAIEKRLILIRANIVPLIQGVTVTLPAGIDVKALKDLQLFSTNN